MNRVNFNDMKAKLIVITILLLGNIAFFISEYGQGLVVVLKHNFLLWLMFILGVVFAIFAHFKYKKDIDLLEIPIQIFSGSLVLIGAYFFFYTYTTDIRDKVVLNDFIKEVVYEESYTEEYKIIECTGSGNNRKCRTVTKTRYVPEDYYIKTKKNIGRISINKREWVSYTKLFKNKKEVDKYRPSQNTFSRMRGEGDIWYSYPNQDYQVSKILSTVNYIKASKYSLMKKDKKSLSKELKNRIYPELENKGYGFVKFKRVWNLNTKISPKELKELNKELDIIAGRYGQTKEVNPIIILSENKDISFYYQVEKHFQGFKKNDLVIVINLENNKIKWVKSRAYTDKKLFLIEMSNKILETKEYDRKKVISVIEDYLKIPSSKNNGFLRKPMADYEYLSSEINLEWYYELIIILLSLSASYFVHRYLKNN